MRLTFLVALAGMALLYVDAGEARADLQARPRPAAAPAPAARGGAAAGGAGAAAARDRPGEAGLAQPMPALPLDEAGKYVAGAYGVFVDADPRLRRDHGRQAAAHRARAAGAHRAGRAAARRARVMAGAPRDERGRRRERVRDLLRALARARAGAGRRAPTTRRSSTSPGRTALVVGAGKVGEGKIEGLLNGGREGAGRLARPRPTRCARWAAEGRIELELRAYETQRPRRLLPRDRRDRGQRHERARVRGRRGAPDALQRRRRDAPVQLHPALDRAPRRPRDRRLDRRREPRDGAPDPARAGAVLRRRVRGRAASCSARCARS